MQRLEPDENGDQDRWPMPECGEPHLADSEFEGNPFEDVPTPAGMATARAEYSLFVFWWDVAMRPAYRVVVGKNVRFHGDFSSSYNGLTGHLGCVTVNDETNPLTILRVALAKVKTTWQ